jgi:hypothetical protein
MIFLFFEWEASQEQIQENDLIYFLRYGYGMINGKEGESWIVQNKMK